MGNFCQLDASLARLFRGAGAVRIREVQTFVKAAIRSVRCIPA
jgi:hypothetical protein